MKITINIKQGENEYNCIDCYIDEVDRDGDSIDSFYAYIRKFSSFFI